MKKSWFPLTFLILLMTIVTAQPSTTIYSFPEGYTIEPVSINYLKINQDHIFNIHVFNNTNGMPITEEIECFMHLYNTTGDHQYVTQTSTPTYDFDYSFFVSGSNFSQIGFYSIKFQCNSTTLGGATEQVFIINHLGKEITTGQSISSLSYLIIMLFLMSFFGILGIKLSGSTYLWVIGVFFLFLSLMFLVYNTWLGYEYHLLLTGLPNSNTPQIIFYVFMTLLLSGTLVSTALLFLHWKKVFRYIKKEIKRPEDNYEDVEEWEVDEWKTGKNKFSGGGFTPPNY